MEHNERFQSGTTGCCGYNDERFEVIRRVNVRRFTPCIKGCFHNGPEKEP